MCTNSILLDYFLDERSTENTWGLIGEYNSTKKCFSDDSDLPWSLDGVWWEGVAYWGFFGGVLLIRENFPPLGKNCLLLSYDSLGIDADSTLEGVSSTPLGKSHFATLEGPASVSWTHGGVLLNFTWDLFDNLDSWRSFHNDFWSTEGFFYAFDPLGLFLMLSIHWECIWCFQSIGDAFLGSLYYLSIEGISIIFRCIFFFPLHF